MSWQIKVAAETLTLTVTAVADDQEIDASATTLNVYSEGLCAITGTRTGRGVTGLA
jgi:predicted secreted hydrolase